MSKMEVKKLGLSLLVLFFFSSSLRPSQHPQVSASNQEIRGRETLVNRRGGGGGGHAGGGGGHSGGHGGGSGHSKGGGSDGNAKGLAVAGVVPLYAAGALNHQNYNNEKKPHHRGSNGSNTNYVGLTQFVFPLLALPLSLSYLLFPFKEHLV